MSSSRVSSRVAAMWCSMVIYVLLSPTINAAPMSNNSGEEMGVNDVTSTTESTEKKSVEENFDEVGSGLEEPVKNSTRLINVTTLISNNSSEEIGVNDVISTTESTGNKSVQENFNEAGLWLEDPVFNSTRLNKTYGPCNVYTKCGPGQICNRGPLPEGLCFCDNHFIDNNNGTGCVPDPESCHGKKDCALGEKCCSYGICHVGLFTERRCHPQGEPCPTPCGVATIIQ